MSQEELAQPPTPLNSSNPPSPPCEAVPFLEHTPHTPRRWQDTPYQTWVNIFWPLVLHVIVATGIVVFMLVYVDDRTFNLKERRPFVRLANDTEIPWDHYSLMQTDITTILSIMLAILRLVTACWLGPLGWRCAFILMEECGLKPRQLRSLISYGIVTPPLVSPGKKQRTIPLLLGITLAVALPVQFAAPVLTGSIAWIPSNHQPEQLSNDPILIPVVQIYRQLIDFSEDPTLLDRYIYLAGSRSFLAWGPDGSNSALKRFVPQFEGLEVNSTVTDITLPYFTVQDIEWVEDPKSLHLGNSFIQRVLIPRINIGNSSYSLGSSVVLIPDTPWANYSDTSRKPFKVVERRLLVRQLMEGQSVPNDFDDRKVIEIKPGYNISTHHEGSRDYIFAWVTYSAGVGTCNNCRISSHATVQNDTELVLQEDHMTIEALRLMPHVASRMLSKVGYGTTPRWKTPDDLVAGLLIRSYAGAWMALVELASATGGGVYTTYSVSPHASRASVTLLRVYIWIGLQSLVTLSAVLFLYVQVKTCSPAVGEATLAVFYLDSSAIHETGVYNQFWGGASRRVEFKGEVLKVKID